MRKVPVLILVYLWILINPNFFALGKELEVVPHLNLEQFQGTWYEIAHNPWFVEKHCFSMIAHYKLLSKGTINITNVCRKNGFDGEISKITGTGLIVEEETQAKWKIQFIWPFTLNYWVIDLETNYQYAVIGEPDKENIWILSREPYLDQKVLSQIIRNTENKGYDLSKLILTPHHPKHSRCLADSIEKSKKRTEDQIC